MKEGTYPPPLKGSDGGFTYISIVKRLPQILDKTLETIPKELLSETQLAQFAVLRESLVNGSPVLVKDNIKDEEWDPLHETHLIQNSWLESAWWYIEIYFYRRMLQILGYFDTSSKWFQKDPFSLQKVQALQHAIKNNSVHQLAQFVTSTMQEKTHHFSILKRLFLFALWGNAEDLSFSAGELKTEDSGKEMDAEKNIVSNQLNSIVDYILEPKKEKRILVYILDNCGLEFVSDLFLANELIALNMVDQIQFHCKMDPIFVSDVMERDVLITLDTLEETKDEVLIKYSQFFRQRFANKEFIIKPHSFYNSPLAFWEFPLDLKHELENKFLVIVKGDANYRRFLNDLHWNPLETTFSQVVEKYFPSPLVCMRTLKSGTLTLDGSDHAKQYFEILTEKEKDWRENGKYGIIQFFNKV